MLRSNNLLFLTLLLFLVLSPQPKKVKAEDNAMAVKSITLLEDKTAKIAFKVEVKDATKAVEFNLDNIADTTPVTDSLLVTDLNGNRVQYSFMVESNKLKLALGVGDYQVEFSDPRITVSSPKYEVKLTHDTNSDQISGTVGGEIKVTNASTYTWPKDGEVRYAQKDQTTTPIALLSTDYETGKTITVPLGSFVIPAQAPTYLIAITEFSTGQAHPSRIMDIKQAWSQSPSPFQLPGIIQFSINGTTIDQVEEKDFKDTIANSSLSLGKRNDLTVTRAETAKAVIKLDNTIKHILKGTFKTDYIYQYTTVPGPDIQFHISSQPRQETKFTAQNSSLRLTHSTDIPDVKLLVSTEDPLESLALDLEKKQKELLKLNKIAFKQLKPDDLVSAFPDAAKFKVSYTLSSQTDFNKLVADTLKENAQLLKRLIAIDYYADTTSKIFKMIPSQSDYQETIRRLATSGVRDADVTLLRKQRSEQIHFASNFLQVYHALVLESSDGFPVRIEIIQANAQGNVRNRIAGPNGVSVQSSTP